MSCSEISARKEMCLTAANQISLDYYTIPPATQANNYIIPVTLLTPCLFRINLISIEIITQTQMNA